tara:strand:+ start:7664 stop:8041 length:378 start_codon:yes stop_codon:yes gene_type:complete
VTQTLEPCAFLSDISYFDKEKHQESTRRIMNHEIAISFKTPDLKEQFQEWFHNTGLNLFKKHYFEKNQDCICYEIETVFTKIEDGMPFARSVKNNEWLISFNMDQEAEEFSSWFADKGHDLVFQN